MGDVPSWCVPGARVGCITHHPGISDPTVSYRTIKAVGKAYVTTEPTHVGGSPDRWSRRDLSRSDGAYAARHQLVDPTGDVWRREVIAANERHRIKKAKQVADQYARGSRRGGVPVSALDVIRALLPVAGLSDEGLADVLAALPPVEA